MKDKPPYTHSRAFFKLHIFFTLIGVGDRALNQSGERSQKDVVSAVSVSLFTVSYGRVLLICSFKNIWLLRTWPKTGLQIKPTQIVLKRRDWNKKYSTGIKSDFL